MISHSFTYVTTIDIEINSATKMIQCLLTSATKVIQCFANFSKKKHNFLFFYTHYVILAKKLLISAILSLATVYLLM